MHLRSAALLLLLSGLVVLAAAERQRFCYKRVGYTRKLAERQQHQQGAVSGEDCQGAACHQPTHYKTEVVFRTERHCCAGYQRAGHSVDTCLPVCSRGCPQGETCTAPNRCDCVEGHERDSDGRCVAVSAMLPGEEPRTLQSDILSHIGVFLDGVKWLAQQASEYLSSRAVGSVPTARSGDLSPRAAWAELSGEGAFSSRCNSTRLQRPGALERRWNSSSPLCCGARPLVVPLAAGRHRLATPQLQ